jgi:hypothetical protein
MSKPVVTYRVLDVQHLSELEEICRVEITMEPSHAGFTHGLMRLVVNKASRDTAVRAKVRQRVLQETGLSYEEGEFLHAPDEIKLEDEVYADPIIDAGSVEEVSDVEEAPVVDVTAAFAFNPSVTMKHASSGEPVQPVQGKKKKRKK